MSYTLPDFLLDPIVKAALHEDFAGRSDITTQTIIPEDTQCTVNIIAREAGILAGLDCILRTFAQIDTGLKINIHKQDGTPFKANDIIAQITGNARSVLMGERVALNFAGHLSGIATKTHQMAALVKNTKAKIVCTRKTLPLMRNLQKQAIRLGGGFNHRFGLDDAVLIKDNHIAINGSINKAVLEAKKQLGHMIKIEVECETMAQIEEALSVGVDAIMLDNMDIPDLKQAITLIAGKAVTEASGGITLNNITQIAQTGVDMISSGSLTHSVKNIDLSFDFVSL